MASFLPQPHGYLEEYKDGYTYNRPFYSQVYSFNPERQLRAKMGVLTTSERQSSFFESFAVPIETNAWGQRDDRTPALEKKPGAARILLLGDSFAFGWPLTAERMLLTKLRGAAPEAEWINCAQMGAGAQQMRIVFEKECGRFQPDLVVAQLDFHAKAIFPDSIGIDRVGPQLRLVHLALQQLDEKTLDLIQQDPEGFPGFDEATLARLKPVFEKATTPRLPFYRQFHLMRFLEHAFFWKASLTSKRILQLHSRIIGGLPKENVHLATERALIELQKQTEAAHAKLLVVVAPGAYAFREGISSRPDWDELLKNLAARKIPVLDLRPAFAEALSGKEIETLYFPDDSHPNEAGQELIARKLGERIRTEFPALLKMRNGN